MKIHSIGTRIIVMAIIALSQLACMSQDTTRFTVVKTTPQTSAEVPPQLKSLQVSVEIPELNNKALKKSVKANGFNDVYLARNAVDGKPTTYWEGTADYPNILTVDLSEPAEISRIMIRLNPAAIWGERVQAFEVLISTDGSDYRSIVPESEYRFDPQTGNFVLIEFDGVQAQFVRLICTKNTGANGAQVAEFIIE